MPMDRQYFKGNICPRMTYMGTVSHTLNIISDFVGTTLGPYGGPNLFKQGPELYASKDGLENLSMVKFNESIPASVYQMALEVANDQARNVGDGTTSAVLVMASVYKHLMANTALWERYTQSQVVNAMSEIQDMLEKTLTDGAIPMINFETGMADEELVKSLLNTTLNNNEVLSMLLTELYYANPEGFADTNILLDYSNSNESYFDAVVGIDAKGKMMSPAFSNVSEDICVLKNAEILLVDGKVSILNDILTYVNQLKAQNKSLLIICSGVNENFYRFIETFAQSQQANMLNNFCVVYSDANTIMNKDAFYDILKSIDATYISENAEVSATNIKDYGLGFAANVSIKNGRVTLGGCRKGDGYEKYYDDLGAQIKEFEEALNASRISTSEQASLSARINKLKSRQMALGNGVITVYAGGDTYQSKHINYRAIEDGIKALQSALKYGYFFGCNTVVPNIVSQLIMDQKEMDKKADNSTPSIYYELEMSILFGYLDVYKRLIQNRTKVSDEECMKIILGDNDYMYDAETGYISFNSELGIPDAIIHPIDLTGAKRNLINPAKTDINIVRRALDAAVVLSTANTIVTDIEEFEMI